MFIRNDLTFKTQNDFRISESDREILTIDLLTKIMKNIIVSCCYKQSNGNSKNHCDLTNATMENKLYFVTRNFNLNCLELHESFRLDNFSITCFKKEIFV